MYYEPILSYYSLTPNVYDGVIEELNGTTPIAHNMFSAKSIIDLAEIFLKEIDILAIYKYQFFSINNGDTFIISINKNKNRYRYFKVTNLSSYDKKRLKSYLLSNVINDCNRTLIIKNIFENGTFKGLSEITVSKNYCATS